MREARAIPNIVIAKDHRIVRSLSLTYMPAVIQLCPSRYTHELLTCKAENKCIGNSFAAVAVPEHRIK